jgi:uncharacterized membrane protein YfhO
VGWHVKVDGKEIKPLTVYDSLMFIPMGEKAVHEVDMYFIPDGIIAGLVISLIAILALMSEELYRRKRAASSVKGQ